MIRRAAVCDVPEVNSWGGGDFAAFIANPMNVVLIDGEGAAFFMWRGPGIYELHLALEQRGGRARDTLRAMLAMMRSHGAQLFWAAIPVDARNVIIFARIMGWKSHGTALFPHGHCEIFVGE